MAFDELNNQELNDAPLFGADSLENVSKAQDIGDFPVTKAVYKTAIGKTPTDQQVDAGQLIDEAYAIIHKQRNEDAVTLYNNALQTNNVNYIQSIIEDTQRLNMLAGEKSVLNAEAMRSKGLEISRVASENFIIQPNIVINNTTQEINNAVEKNSKAMSSAMELEKIAESAKKTSTIAKGIFHAITPLSIPEGLTIDSVLAKNGVPKEQLSWRDSQDQSILWAQTYIAGLSKEDQIPKLLEIYKDLKDSYTVSNWKAASVILQIASGVAPDDTWYEDLFNKLGGIAGVGTLAMAVAKAARTVSTAGKMSSTLRTLAANGGKSAEETAELTKIANELNRKGIINAGGTIAGEVTGITAVIDASKLVSLGALKVLPDSLTTSVHSKYNKLIGDPLNKLINDLQETAAIKGIRSEEIAQQIKDFEMSYSKATDPSIHSVRPFTLSEDGRYVTGSIIRQTSEGIPFITENAAKAFAEAHGLKNYTIIPDTTNTMHVIKEDVVKALELEKTAILSQLVELEQKTKKAKGAKITDDILTKDGEKNKNALLGDVNLIPPSSLKANDSSKYGLPKGAGVVDVLFNNPIDKAAYQVGSKTPSSKTDKEITEWLKKTTGWSDEQIKQHAQLVRNHIKEATKTIDVVESGKLSVKSLVPETKQTAAEISTSGGMPSTKLQASYHSLGLLFKTDVADSITIGNVRIHETLGTPLLRNMIGTFTTRVGKLLGMDDLPIIVADLTDLRTMSKYSKFRDAANEIYKNSPNSLAMHISIPEHGSIILFNQHTVKTAGINKMMDTFAHEYAHAFEWVFFTKHSETIEGLYKSWLVEKGLVTKEGTTKKLPLPALLQFRSISNASEEATFINQWYSGNRQKYWDDYKTNEQWLKSYHEWFAEQFSKWSLTDEIPTTLLGETFYSVVQAIKNIKQHLENVLSTFGVEIKLDPAASMRNFMNEHIKSIKNGEYMFKNLRAGLVQESRGGSKMTKKALVTRLESIEEELAAHADSTTGLKGGWLVESQIEKALQYTGKYTQEDLYSASRFNLGDWALRTSKEVYSDRVLGVTQQSRYQKLLTEFIRKDVEKLSSKERVALDNALVLGDKESKVWSDIELAGMDMSKNTRQAYKKVRALRDVMYKMRNEAAVETLVRRGYMRLSSPDITLPPDGPNLFAKEIPIVENKKFYNASTGKLEQFDSTKHGKIKLYEFIEQTPIDKNGTKTLVKTIGVDGSTSKLSKIDSVIPYREGEYRRIYSDQYFVKIRGLMNVDGVDESILQTHRTASNSVQANKYVEAFNKAVNLFNKGELDVVKAADLMQPYGWNPSEFIAALNRSEFGKNIKAEVLYTRTDDDYVKEAIFVGVTSNSKRGEHIPDVFGNTSTNTLNPLDAIASEITNTSVVASVTQWREAHVHKWFNTFKDFLPDHVQKMDVDKAFAYMLNNKSLYIGQSKDKDMAMKVQEYIVSQLNIPSKEERMYQGIMRNMSETIEGKWDNKFTHKVGLFLRNTNDFPTFMRTISFHSFFGFNPVQLAVQGMNAFNAITISPIYGVKAAKSMPFVRLALMSDNEEIWRTMGRVNRVSLGMDVDEFVETVRLIRRSGLLDGINSTSLYGAEIGKYGLFNGVSRKAGETSAFFFNRGEEASRLISFDIARREWKANNPGKAWFTDDALVNIMSRQDDLTQNMTKANIASWQKGLASIPTQFIQYQVKLMVNVIQSLLGNSRTFTKQEAAQLLIGHSLVMGTAGTFFGLPLMRQLLGNAVDDLEITEEQKLYIQQGIVAGIIGSLTEGDVRLGIGKRFNTFAYYDELVSGLLDPEKTWLELVAGASGGAMTNILGGAGRMLKTVVGNDLSPSSLKVGITELATSSFSSLNNLHKADIAKNNYNYVMSKTSGNKLYSVTDSEAFFLALGIPPAKASDLDAMYKSKKAQDDILKAETQEISRRAMLAASAYNNGDMESYKVHTAVIDNIIADTKLRYGDRAKLFTEWRKSEPFSMYNKLIVEQMVRDFKLKDVVVNNKLGEY